jgi:hypothetical protein
VRVCSRGGTIDQLSQDRQSNRAIGQAWWKTMIGAARSCPTPVTVRPRYTLIRDEPECGHQQDQDQRLAKGRAIRRHTGPGGTVRSCLRLR